MKNLIITLLLAGLTRALFAAPATWVQSVTYNSETITMRLTQEALRGSEFELWSQNASGGYDVVTPVAERSYIGSVDGYPGAVSCGILQDDGTFRGAVYFDRGATWFTLGTAVVDTHGLDYSTFSSFQFPTAATVGAGQAGSSMVAYDLGVDADYDFFTNAGSIAKAFEGIEYSVCIVRAIYMRDVLLRPYLGRVIIRETLAQDPYTGLTQGDYLTAVKDEWNNNQTTADRDLVVGTSPTKIGGGLAWVGTVGSSIGYSACNCRSNVNFDAVFRHEMGHSWGCGHYVGGFPEGTGIMGGNKPGRFSGCEVYVILNHRDSRAAGILDDEGTYTAIELPPYASMDAGVFVQTVTPSLTFDVLANDHDANGQTVSLASYDEASANGGSVTQQGQNLVYTAPTAFLGDDYFMYTITDTAGRTATGVVIVNVEFNDALQLYLPLDETTGTTAVDYSTALNNGTLSADFSAVSVAGQYGNAVNFDGVDDYIKVSDMGLSTERGTLAAWIKPSATQTDRAGIVFDRGIGESGLSLLSNGKLCYRWGHEASSYNWDSNLTPPADSWTFVALVVEPSRAIIYMNSGSGFQSATNNAPHPAATFSNIYIGKDSSYNRHFTGAIDDVRLYNEAMAPLELQNMYDGAGADSSRPFDGAVDVASSVLRWSPGPAATAYDVYIGTNQAAVAAATKASPEYQETTVDTFLYSSFLSDSTAYFWRIDTVTASTTLAGSVRSFSTGILPPPGDTILINFERSSEESFYGGELIGPTADDSSNWNTAFGASGMAANLVDNSDAPTAVDIQWQSANTWGNGDGTSSDEHRMATGYLDDGNSGSGKGVTITLNNIPYTTYRVYGLFATDNGTGMINFNVNGAWALGGSASTTASAWGSIDDNYAAHGEYWTEIESGVTQGNYWVTTTSGSTCTITGEPRNGYNRGSLTAVIIEKIDHSTHTPPVWNEDPIAGTDAIADSAYVGTLAGKASEPDGDTITYSKTGGPAWLTVASNGTLGGTPSSASDLGLNTFTVVATDIDGSTSATLKIIAFIPPTQVEVVSADFEGSTASSFNTAPGGGSWNGTATSSSNLNAGTLGGTWSVSSTSTLGNDTLIDVANGAYMGDNQLIMGIHPWHNDNPGHLTTATLNFDTAMDLDGLVLTMDAAMLGFGGQPGQTYIDLMSGTTVVARVSASHDFGEGKGSINHYSAIGDYGQHDTLLAPEGAIWGTTDTDIPVVNIAMTFGATEYELKTTGAEGADINATGLTYVNAATTIDSIKFSASFSKAAMAFDTISVSMTSFPPPVPVNDLSIMTGSIFDRTTMEISWTGENGRLYIVETNSNLTSGDWQPLTTGHTGTGNPMTVTHMIGATTQLFYRVISE